MCCVSALSSIAPALGPNGQNEPPLSSGLPIPNRATSPVPLDIWVNVAEQLPTPALRAFLDAAPAIAHRADLTALMRRRTEFAATLPAQYVLVQALMERQRQAERLTWATLPVVSVACIAGMWTAARYQAGEFCPLRDGWLLLPCLLAMTAAKPTDYSTKIRRLNRATACGAAIGALWWLSNRPGPAHRAAATFACRQPPAGSMNAARQMFPKGLCAIVSLLVADVLRRISVHRLRYDDDSLPAGTSLEDREAFLHLGQRIFSSKARVWDAHRWSPQRLVPLCKFIDIGSTWLLPLPADAKSTHLFFSFIIFLEKANLRILPRFALRAFDCLPKPDAAVETKAVDALALCRLWKRTTRPEIVADELIADLQRSPPLYAGLHALFRMEAISPWDGLQGEAMQAFANVYPRVGHYTEELMALPKPVGMAAAAPVPHTRP